MRYGILLCLLISGTSFAADPCEPARKSCEAWRHRAYVENSGVDNPQDHENMRRACDAYADCDEAERNRKADEQTRAYMKQREEKRLDEERRALEQREAIDAQRRVERERAEKEAAEAAAADEAEDDRIRNDAKKMALIMGAELCLANATRAAAFKEIETEKKYARIGGYENKAKIYGLQIQIRKADEFLAKEKQLLRTASNLKRVHPLPCTDKGVKSIMAAKVACGGDEPPSDCEEPLVKRVLSFIGLVGDDDDQ